MAKQNIKLTKSLLQAHADRMSTLESIADKQCESIKNTLNAIKGCFDSQLAAEIDDNISESLALYKKLAEHMHVGARCVSLVLKNSEVTDDNCAAQIEKLIADPPPETVIARCLYANNSYYLDNNCKYTTNDGSWVYVWNRYGKEVSCTYHTLRRLHEKGLDYPFANKYKSHGGGAWYQNCNTDLADVRTGANAIEQLIQEFGYPLENVVIDFPGKPGEYGHIMLIDRIYEDGGVIKVDFSDMGSRTKYGDYQTDPNGKGFEYYGWTLDDFKKSYSRSNGSIGAATLIGAAP